MPRLLGSVVAHVIADRQAHRGEVLQCAADGVRAPRVPIPAAGGDGCVNTARRISRTSASMDRPCSAARCAVAPLEHEAASAARFERHPGQPMTLHHVGNSPTIG
jgi:hypothetical protein